MKIGEKKRDEFFEAGRSIDEVLGHQDLATPLLPFPSLSASRVAASTSSIALPLAASHGECVSLAERRTKGKKRPENGA